MQAGSTSYTWNARNQLSGVTGTGVSASFQYNAAGSRTSSSVNGITTSSLYAGSGLVQQQSSQSGTTNFLSGGNGEIFSRSNGTNSLSPLVDAIGSTRSLTDSSGATTAEFAYDPFGASATTGEAGDHAFQFAGNENDGTGLQFTGSDYYDPTSQRSISETFAGDNATAYRETIP